MPKIRVLIVDDAVVIRRVLTDALGSDPDIEVHSAANGRIGLAKIEQIKPDLVTLDIEMPEMDGLAALKEIRKLYPKLPVIMFSTLTERGASATLDALALGATDYLTKPANVGSVAMAIARIKTELIPKIKAHCGKPELPPQKAAVAPVPASRLFQTPTLIAPASPRSTGIEIVAIGISTGGPNALQEMIPMLPASLSVPIVIVQHMPPIFTKMLADRLRQQSKIDVQEGAAGMRLKAGQVVIAPGGSHMVLQRSGFVVNVALNSDAPENSCRPAVDVLFRSVVAAYGARALGVIMTGMGSDGLHGCELIRQTGGQVFVQDEASSVVWGMPGFVGRAGLADRQLPLSQIAGEIVRRVGQNKSVLAAAG